MRSFAVFILFFCTINVASAELLNTAPSQACILLNDFGLATSGWKNEYDQEFGCSSDYKQIGSGFPLANNIAFYVEGNNNSVVQVNLMLNVNDRTSASSAHQELLKAAKILGNKQTGKQLSQKLIDAITKGSNTSQKIGNATVDIVREDWPTGRGYEVKVTLK
ncbi:conserved exported hypothetical protein [Candidatus Methylobacter favarea]|uniref:Uncharacterized protein n=1 Tax=Candidatus Methylobacter favarea TaxID=2707345 RepID=A0A8S0WHJ7_9GAMM|nr:DUF6030 family protein [Candidatus Methylobacter favarea]CAA9889869.1 conserved exported hypothetical protein [Candidatus Methylobacter favarea]